MKVKLTRAAEDDKYGTFHIAEFGKAKDVLKSQKRGNLLGVQVKEGRKTVWYTGHPTRFDNKTGRPRDLYMSNGPNPLYVGKGPPCTINEIDIIAVRAYAIVKL